MPTSLPLSAASLRACMTGVLFEDLAVRLRRECTTDTQTGVVVTAYLDRSEYPTRLKPDPQLVSSLRLVRG